MVSVSPLSFFITGERREGRRTFTDTRDGLHINPSQCQSPIREKKTRGERGERGEERGERGGEKNGTKNKETKEEERREEREGEKERRTAHT